MHDRVKAILEFWFGLPPEYAIVSDERMKLWFGGTDATNQQIAKLFTEDTESACAGQLDRWENQNESLTALIILLDQFSRNIYRNTRRAFATDGKALEIVRRVIESGRDIQLKPLQRLFIYLPLEHAEDLDMQNLSVAKFTELAQTQSGQHRKAYNGFVDYAVQHQRIVEQFGRFPHRNKILDRESSLAEIDFLQKPGSSF